MKVCNRCGEQKELSLFAKDNRRPDGKRSHCLACAAKASSVWQREDKEKADARMHAWRKLNPKRLNENSRRQAHNRRARIREVGGRLSIGIAARLFELQRGKCACGCKQPLGDDYHLDHRMPLALGGANEDWNIQLLRSTCNQQKHAKHPVDFMQSRGYLL